MSFVIIRGPNGRHHDVDFAGSPISVDIAGTGPMIQITIEQRDHHGPSDKCPFATMTTPRSALPAALEPSDGPKTRNTPSGVLRLVVDRTEHDE